MAVNGGGAGRFDWTAVRAGGALALVIGVPLFVAAGWASGRESPGLAALFSLGALLAFTAGAACAAWLQQRRLPLAHGLVTAILAYVAVQVVVTIYRLAVGTTVNWFNIMFFLTMASLAGLLGGAFGQRLRRIGFVPPHERRIDLGDRS